MEFSKAAAPTRCRVKAGARTFKAGDVITVRFNPMKDGSAGGLFIGATFEADGKDDRTDAAFRGEVRLTSRSLRRR